MLEVKHLLVEQMSLKVCYLYKEHEIFKTEIPQEIIKVLPILRV